MSEGGYEVLGPAHGPIVPAPLKAPSIIPGKKPTAPPPAPPLKVVEKKKPKTGVSESESVAVDATNRSVLEAPTKRGASSMRSAMSEMEESRMGSCDGTAISQRPNACDTIQLSCLIFFVIIVIAVSIPVLLAATDSADIGWIKEKLSQLD